MHPGYVVILASYHVRIGMEIDPSTLGRLLQVRDLVRLSSELKGRGTRLGEAEALVILDAGVEAALPIVLSIRGISLPSRVDFPDLVTLMVGKDILSANQAAAIGRLHHVRNEVQHFGLIPDPLQTQEIGSGAVAVVRNLLERIGTPLDLISSALLFRDGPTRSLFTLAEDAYRAGDLDAAAIALIATFEYARQLEQSRIYGSGITWVQSRARNPEGTPTPHMHDGLANYAEGIHDEVEILKLRLDYKAYRKFVDETGGKLSPRFIQDLPSDMDPKSLVEKWKAYLAPWPLDVSEAWLRFAFEFVRDSILRWESLERSGLWEGLTGALDALAKAFSPKSSSPATTTGKPPSKGS